MPTSMALYFKEMGYNPVVLPPSLAPYFAFLLSRRTKGTPGASTCPCPVDDTIPIIDAIYNPPNFPIVPPETRNKPPNTKPPKKPNLHK